MIRFIAVVIALAGFSRSGAAQDAVKVDPAHHKLELENAQVRVLRVTLEPGAKTPVHEHPASVVTFLTDAQIRVSPVGGKPNETPRKAKDVVAIEATRHTAENLGGAPVELILVELKAAPGAGR
ncbi:MAG TPA: cupin domain-containing protein [Candidatus Methylomirabilis sp.]|jgi:quercetin dioxygenase-like cupin family protein